MEDASEASEGSEYNYVEIDLEDYLGPGENSQDTQPTMSDSQDDATNWLVLDRNTSSRGRRSRCWRFTDFTSTHPWIELPPGVRYAVMQQEVCPTTARVHLQGYVQLEKDQYPSYMTKLRPHANWGTCNGTPAQNRAYCSKVPRLQHCCARGIYFSTGENTSDWW